MRFNTNTILQNICGLMLGFTLVACNEPAEQEPAASNIVLNPTTLTLHIGETGILRYSGAAETPVWSNSDTTVADVAFGVISAKAVGNTYITCADSYSSAVCHVYVVGSDGASLRVSPTLIEMDKEESYQLQYGNTYGLPMTWASSNPEIATVSESGMVTAHKAGVAIITLSTGGESVECIVSVRHTWSNYNLVWSDEFNGSELDASVWTIQTGIGNNGWGNQEKQYYTGRPENLRVEDGNLIIEARKEDYEGSQYTSARIITRDKQTFTYGKMEARISLPSGGGLWPAFWMLGNSGSWPACGEIDIMEYVGNVPNRILGTLHTTKDRDGAKSSKAYTGCQTIEDNYHIYGVEWTQEEEKGKDIIRFYVDDEVYNTQVEAQIDNHDYWPFNQPHFFILNMAVGGTLGGQINDAIFETPRLMKIDWVRVYQREEIE